MAQYEEALVRDEDVKDVAAQLAAEADISEEQAQRVLKVLHIDKLNENLQAVQEIVGNEKAVNALGWSQSTAREMGDALNRSSFSLENLRIGIKAPSQAGILV